VPGHAPMVEFKLDKAEFSLMDVEGEILKCLDKDNKEQVFKMDPESELYKNLKGDFDAGKQLAVTVVRAPVEVTKDKFVDEELVESFKEEKTE